MEESDKEAKRLALQKHVLALGSVDIKASATEVGITTLSQSEECTDI